MKKKSIIIFCFLILGFYFTCPLNINSASKNISSQEESRGLTNYRMGFFEKNMLAKANKLYEEKKYDDALEAYRELRDKYMENPIAYYGMGSVYFSTGIYDLAIDRFSTAIKLDPEFVPAIKWLGNCYMKKGNKEAADRYRNMAEEVIRNKVKK